MFIHTPLTEQETVNIKDGKITYTFTAQTESTQFLIYKDVAGQSDVDLNVTIEKAILVEGNKVTGWSPAPEETSSALRDYNTRISSAETFIEKTKKRFLKLLLNLMLTLHLVK